MTTPHAYRVPHAHVAAFDHAAVLLADPHPPRLGYAARAACRTRRDFECFELAEEILALAEELSPEDLAEVFG